ncbi:sodium:calcium antiporter [Microbacterium thalassium]|uniref:Cation:H+ antiporter n=1 Tax=Microbacterium thalassium TaxID=362649 RepID=A0A7X0FN91_9MICO|nr:sodium:calcium symporter [Microbacterium thalassium]MBB6390608.1 cation:H+ antiporter [Microbacterium thalassium]GLK25718.1 cation transporter [Microbacterium thalassium]
MTEPWPLWPSVLALAGAVIIIIFAGSRLARAADEIADRTGIGEAVAGAVFLGAVTSLPGIVTTATGALAGDAAFALANPIGGIALQTVWLAIADLVYRRANLEHAAASLENILQAIVLIALMALPVIAFATPDLQIGWIHPVTILIPVFYLYGLHLVRRVHEEPMWRPIRTSETREDEGGPVRTQSLVRLWGTLASLGLVVAVTGWVIGQAGLSVVAATGWSSGITGFTLTTAITSLPELIVLIAAIRMGALTLGVANIIGGNVFDVLTLSVADSFYLEGTIYSAAGAVSLVLLGGTLLITAVLGAGLVMRDRQGIGFEGIAIPALYAGTIALAVSAL